MKDNKLSSRFELKIDESIVFANYRLEDKTLYIDYVEAPQELRGNGAAGKLMEKIVKKANDENLKIIPICGYAATWLQRHKYSY